jgi:hypothetical protein
MKRTLLGMLLAVFVITTSALVASATTNDGTARTATPAPVHASRATALYLIAAFQAPDHTAQQERQDSRDNDGERGRDKGKGKGKFHGAEMGPTTILFAGIFALSAYFLLVRRRTQKHL